MPFKNTQRRAAAIWLLIGVMGLFTTFIPGWFHMDLPQGGAAIMFLGVFAAISGIIVSILFFRRSKIIQDALLGKGPIIHWRYDEDIWEEYANKEFEYRKGENKALTIVIGSMCLIMGLIFCSIKVRQTKLHRPCTHTPGRN